MIKEFIGLFFTRIFPNSRKIFKFVPSHKSFSSGTTREVTRNGIKYKLDISDYQQWLIYFNCKSDSSDHVLNYLGDATTILDVGANIGQTALKMFQSQDRKGLMPNVYAFEPFPDTFEKLTNNISLNQLESRIHCINKGLGAQSGNLPMLKHNEANSGGYRIVNEANTATISVGVTTLDQFVLENKIKKVDFIKIDVEGFEFEVLKGMQTVLETHKPIVIFEYDTQNLADLNINPQEIFIYLQNLNYTFKDVNGFINFGEIANYTGHTDIVCYPA